MGVMFSSPASFATLATRWPRRDFQAAPVLRPVIGRQQQMDKHPRGALVAIPFPLQHASVQQDEAPRSAHARLLLILRTAARPRAQPHSARSPAQSHTVRRIKRRFGLRPRTKRPRTLGTRAERACARHIARAQPRHAPVPRRKYKRLPCASAQPHAGQNIASSCSGPAVPHAAHTRRPNAHCRTRRARAVCRFRAASSARKGRACLRPAFAPPAARRALLLISARLFLWPAGRGRAGSFFQGGRFFGRCFLRPAAPFLPQAGFALRARRLIRWKGNARLGPAFAPPASRPFPLYAVCLMLPALRR